jgi:hypothetical protein
VTSRLDTDAALAALWQRLPGIARQLVESARYPEHPKNARFLADPDDPAEHETRWHQWGIITHTRMFERHHVETVPGLLARWGVAGPVARALERPIDGTPRSGLLRLAVPLHDLGKFALRQVRLARNGRTAVSFKHHEAESGRIIRAELRGLLCDELGLTDAQFGYVAECAARHYELAHVRDALKSAGAYTIDRVRSFGFGRDCLGLMLANAGYELEIGLLWLADSLAKVGAHFAAETDAELAAREPEIRAAARSLDPGRDLFDPVRQTAVNAAVAEVYLKLWAACAAA